MITTLSQVTNRIPSYHTIFFGDTAGLEGVSLYLVTARPDLGFFLRASVHQQPSTFGSEASNHTVCGLAQAVLYVDASYSYNTAFSSEN